MKQITSLLMFIFLTSLNTSGQEKKLYNPAANANTDIEAAIKKAASEKKFVVLQVGGNWCSWCVEFERISKANPQIDSVINSSFIIIMF